MADRTVSVKLIADASAYIRGVDEAARKTRESSDQIEQRLAQQREAYQQVGTVALAFGAIAAAGVAAAVNAYAEFDAAMSNVQAATGETEAGMDRLSEAALEAGAQTVYSATEAAGAIEELSKAGLTTADILGGALDGSLSLAAAGGIGVAEAAETAASAMTQFGLEGGDVTHIADLLAAAAGNAQGGVSDMGQALGQAGLVAAQMGLSIEETTGTLASFASAGLIGSDAGTSFRAMLLRLANPTNEVRTLMDELGLSFYDAQGDFIGMEGVAGQLQDRMGGLDQETRNAALATIFGQDAIRAASILYEEGAQGVAEWTSTVDDAGYAAEQAAARQDNLRGDLEALGGAFETLLITLGAGVDGPLRGMVSGLDDLVSGLAQMPDWASQATIGVAALTAGLLLAGGAALVAIPQIAATSAALTGLGITAASARAGLASMATYLGNPYVVAAAAAVAGLLVLKDALESTRASASQWSAVVEGGASAMQLFGLANEGVNFGSWDLTADNIENVGSYLDLLTERADNTWAALNPANIELDNSGFEDTLGRIDDRLGEIAASGDFESVAASFESLTAGLNLTDEQAAQLLDTMPQVRDAFVDAYGSIVAGSDGSIESADLLAEAFGETATAAEGTTDAVDDVAISYQTTAEAAQEMLDAQRMVNDQFFAAESAASAYEQSIDDIAAAFAEGLSPALANGGASFDLTQQSGRDAAAMMQELVTNANAATDSLIGMDAGSEAVAAQQGVARQQIYDTAIQMGLSSDAAWAYADRLVAIPDAVFTTVDMNTGAAEAEIGTFFQRWDGRTIRLNTATGGWAGPQLPGGAIAQAQGGIVEFFAQGGFHGFTPMEPIAQMVPANTWRVVGDRGDVPEAYIPLDGSLRSRQIMLEAAQHFGYQLMAQGGFAGAGSMASSSAYYGGSTVINNNAFSSQFDVRVPVGDDVILAARQVKREFESDMAGVAW